MNKQKLKAFGDYIIICVNDSLFAPKYDDINIIFNNSELDKDFIIGRVSSVGENVEGLYNGDIVLVDANTNLINIGSNKAGVIYAVEAIDIICSIEDMDED